MKPLLAAIVLTAAGLAPVGVAAEQTTSSGDQLDCNDGPVKKLIAGNKWKMRGCSDGRSLVFMLNEGNQSKAAYIAIRYRGPDYELIAGGKTDATEVQVAWQWAKGLTRPEIEALYAETQQKKRRA